MRITNGQRSLPAAVLDRVGELGLPRVLLLAVLLGGLGLAALGPVTADPHALQVGASAAAASLCGLLLTVLGGRHRAASRRQERLHATAAGTDTDPRRAREAQRPHLLRETATRRPPGRARRHPSSRKAGAPQ